ncbi:MAG: hypothetical protein DRR19_32010 [Candidatus Parabeggiatoa sp. nov. 1]|nr:MAG: hypothetical protein DRR19_32010 [Gammaproteobacteria bacterium]
MIGLRKSLVITDLGGGLFEFIWVFRLSQPKKNTQNTVQNSRKPLKLLRPPSNRYNQANPIVSSWLTFFVYKKR